MSVKPWLGPPPSALLNGDMSGQPVDLDLVFLAPPSIGERTAGGGSIAKEANTHGAVRIMLRLRHRCEEVDLTRNIEGLPGDRKRDTAVIEIDHDDLAAGRADRARPRLLHDRRCAGQHRPIMSNAKGSAGSKG